MSLVQWRGMLKQLGCSHSCEYKSDTTLLRNFSELNEYYQICNYQDWPYAGGGHSYNARLAGIGICGGAKNIPSVHAADAH